MYDHIGLRTPDLAASAAFYSSALAPLGIERTHDDETTVGFGSTDGSALWLHADSAASNTHLALRAPSRDAVDAFHAAALAAGGRDNGAPGIRADYGPTYYAAFVIDPGGNNLEAVCFA